MLDPKFELEQQIARYERITRLLHHYDPPTPLTAASLHDRRQNAANRIWELKQRELHPQA